MKIFYFGCKVLLNLCILAVIGTLVFLMSAVADTEVVETWVEQNFPVVENPEVEVLL